jgi:hypothetical protein
MKLGILTGKFKPPHAGHYKTILEIADTNDETYVFVSPREEGGVTGDQAMKILKVYFRKRPDIKIVLAEKSPVTSAYDFIEELGKSNRANTVNLRVYGLALDLSRFSSLDKFKGNIKSVEKKETTRPDFETGSKISGTLMRQFLKDGDKDNFVKGLPKGSDKEEIWKIVTEQIEEADSWKVPADSFTQSTDPNIMPASVNVPVGGLPSHWTTSQPYSRFDLKTNPLADRYGRNPKPNNRVKSFDEFVADK